MTKDVEPSSMAEDYKDTSCYTYEVTMLVQVLAPDKSIADVKIDQDGGYVSKRDVVFKYSTLLYKDGLEKDSVDYEETAS